MANATATELQQLYIAYFGRAADPTGLDYWTDKGITTKAFAANMYAQNEFKSVYGDLSTESQVNQIYQNLFDRDADATGLLYWSKQIKNGTLELASIANDLIWAANNNSGSADDKTALTNKSNAAVAYTAKVRETTSAILAYSAESTSPWVSGVNITEAVNYFSGIDKDTVHTTAGISSSVSTISTNGVQSTKEASQSFSLTIGVDSFTGAGSADTFDASLAGSLDTSDVIDGKGGTDTLSATLAGESLRPNITNVENIIYTASADTLTIDTRDISGVTTITNESSVGKSTFNYLSTIPTFALNSVSSSGDVTINFTDAALAGSADELKLNLNNFGGASDIIVTDGGGTTNKLETIAINSTSLASTVTVFTTDDVDATTLKITGDEDLTLSGSVSTDFTTINASAFTGDLTVTGANTTAVTFTGGSGIDTVTTVGGADTLEGGAGNDILTSGAGNDTLKGGAGNDTFKFVGNNTAAGELTKDDSIDGGDGTDTINFFTNASDSIVTDALFAGVTNTEVLSTTGTVNLEAALGTKAAATGINRVTFTDSGEANVVTIDKTFTNDLTVDISVDTTSGDSITADADYANALTVNAPTANLDTGHTATANLNTVTGGKGSDTLNIQLGASVNIIATELSLVTLVETFSITDGDTDTDATFNIALADENASYTSATNYETLTVDATSIGASSDTVNVSAAAELDGKVIIKGGDGVNKFTLSSSANLGDTITGGGGNDSIVIDTSGDLTKADSVDAGDGTDTLIGLGDTTIVDIDLTGVSNFEKLTGTASKYLNATFDTLASSTGITEVTFLDDTNDDLDSLTLKAGYTPAIIVNLDDEGAHSLNTVDASAYVGAGLTVKSNFKFLEDLTTAFSPITGSANTNDVFQLSTGATTTTAATGANAAQSKVLNFETFEIVDGDADTAATNKFVFANESASINCNMPL